ncbi:T-complex 11 [Xylariomycetidae sp. FL2044]|nr:T-complex 11 [Xylariomycetidae sp. FL2044]
MGDQGTGGISSNTSRRLSEPHPNSHEEQIQQQTAEAEIVKPESKENMHATRSGPRQVPGGGANGGLSRNPSTSSNASGVRFERQQRPPMPLEPPVTKATLSELDVTKIIHNPKLRHDINFDPELHFRPNLDGEKGKRKQEKANQFWNALREQLQMFVGDRDEFMRRFGNGEEWCLPLLLRSVKEIIQTLVPTKDRMYLDEGLNVDLIMQQFSRGVADLEKLASWLSGVLKSHCAPMRDEWVDKMYNQLTDGNRNNDMEELVHGLRNLLSVLEAMKLDVANHQIRCLRPILLEDTVHFEQRFFLKKIRDNKIDPCAAQDWYARRLRSPLLDHEASLAAFGEMAHFFEALVNLVLPTHNDETDSPPNTFLFDEERVMKLRNDMLDAINLEICMRVYEDWERKYSVGTPSAIPTPYLATPFSDASGFLSTRTDDEGSEFNFSNSRPSSLVFSSAGSASSSPRSSFIMPSVAPAIRQEDQRAKSRNLYNSLVALLQTAPACSRSGSRWRDLTDSLALQIFRFTNAPAQELMQLEKDLHDALFYGHKGTFASVEAYYHRRLLASLQQRVRDLRGLTGVSLFSVATGGRLQGPGRPQTQLPQQQQQQEVKSNNNNNTGNAHEAARDRDRELLENSIREAREEGGIEDMATRMAHLGLLHWRVWSKLAYLGGDDLDVPMSDAPTLI